MINILIKLGIWFTLMTNEKIIELNKCDFTYKPINHFTFNKGNIKKFNSETVLKNISLDLYKNKTYGLIGKNGSGKSTLIKLLLNIIQPSSGHVIKNYLNAKLLDKPLFFHTELNALDNFQALLLVEKSNVLKSNQQNEKLENFCEISQLSKNDLIKPISYLSRGSKSKVGFALTMSFLESIDVLGLDEFFSFGDEKYKKFSSEYIKNRLQNTKSSIIVSHSMKIIEDTCDEVIVINDGRVEGVYKPEIAIKLYSSLG